MQLKMICDTRDRSYFNNLAEKLSMGQYNSIKAVMERELTGFGESLYER